MNLDVVWNGHGDFEKEYILNDVLGGFDITLHTSNNDVIVPNALIVYGYNEKDISPEFSEYLSRYNDSKTPYGLMHLSNEGLEHNFDYYQNAEYVLRTYLDERIKNAYHFPIGYRSGHQDLSNNPVAFKDKYYDFFFAGQEKNDRTQMLEAIAPYNSYIHLTQHFWCPTQLSVSEYQELTSRSKFIPCAMGFVNTETFRLCEALQSGSIPVLKRYSTPEYYQKLLGAHPIPTVDSWEDLGKLVDQYQGSDYDDKVQELMEWYHSYKLRLKQEVFAYIVK